ncbi:MAG TPA: hypothetical protein VGC76_00760 [Pyrinomonadaceae bacterium]|jgi:hypothetical protein
MHNKFIFLLVLTLIFVTGLACSGPGGGNVRTMTEAKNTQLTEKLESYTLRGLRFSYYKIPAGLKKEDLIKTAQEIHEGEPDAHLVLVDDDAQIAEYINYARAFSKNDFDAELPKEWADKHIVANLQRLVSGKWQLYEGYGYREITNLK